VFGVNSASRSQRGFTLLEVLIALTIVALALAAMVEAGSRHAWNAARLRDKTVAEWVAMNQLTLLQLRSELPAAPSEEGDREEQLGQMWQWRAAIEQVTIPDFGQINPLLRGVNLPQLSRLRQVTITVWRDGEDETAPLATLNGFLRGG